MAKTLPQSPKTQAVPSPDSQSGPFGLALGNPSTQQFALRTAPGSPMRFYLMTGERPCLCSSRRLQNGRIASASPQNQKGRWNKASQMRPPVSGRPSKGTPVSTDPDASHSILISRPTPNLPQMKRSPHSNLEHGKGASSISEPVIRSMQISEIVEWWESCHPRYGS